MTLRCIQVWGNEGHQRLCLAAWLIAKFPLQGAKSIIISYPQIGAAESQGWGSEGTRRRKETERRDKLGKARRNERRRHGTSGEGWGEKSTDGAEERRKWKQERGLSVVPLAPVTLRETVAGSNKCHHLDSEWWAFPSRARRRRNTAEGGTQSHWKVPSCGLGVKGQSSITGHFFHFEMKGSR